MALDQDTINAQLELLAVHRRTLAVYLRQQAELGVLAPPGVANGIAETQSAIHRIKEQLRADGVLIADEPNDDVQPTAIATHVRLTPQEQRNRRTMLTKVKTIWIDGLLEQSLAKELRIALDLTEQLNAVDLPLNALVQELNRPPRELPVGTPIIRVFDQMIGTLLILGAPGAGKTILLLELARDLIAHAEQDEGHSIPVVFSLSSWATKRQPLKDWLVEELNTRYDVPRKLAQAWMNTDVVLPLLDGLDEVATDWRSDCVATINIYREEHGLVPLTVCSRIADYEALRDTHIKNHRIVRVTR
jgi:Cdc6-like AAA superfamily ATPase